MKRRIISFALVATVATILLSPASDAQTFDCTSVSLDVETGTKAKDALDQLFINGCLGADLCTADLFGYEATGTEAMLCDDIKVWKDEHERHEQDSDRKAGHDDQVDEAGELIVRIIASLQQIETPAGSQARQVQRIFLERMRDIQEQLWYAQSVAGLPTSAWTMSTKMFQDEVDFKDALESVCASTPENCSATLVDLTGIFSHGSMISRLFQAMLKTYRQATVKHVKTVNEQWTWFRTSGRSMLPWEIWLNDRTYKEKPFAAPPERQWILFHPQPAYEFSGEFEEQLFEAAALELFGFYRMNWDEGSKKPKRPWGMSIVATWRDHPNDEHLGFGSIFHFPKNWSVGVTWREGDEYSILLGADAAKWFTTDGRLQNALRKRLFGK